MQLKATDAQGKNYRVYLNGRIVQYALAASEEEGWVEVLDQNFIGMIAPITQQLDFDTSEPEEVPELKSKRLTGKVELKLIPLKVNR